MGVVGWGGRIAAPPLPHNPACHLSRHRAEAARVGGQALLSACRPGCGAVWVTAVAVSVHEAGVVIAGLAVRGVHGDRLAGDRGADDAEPGLPLAGGIWRMVGVQGWFPAVGAPSALGAHGALGGWGQWRGRASWGVC